MSDHTNSQISRRSIELLALAVLVAIVAAVAAWLVNSGSANAAGATAGGGAAPSGQFAPVQQGDDGSGSDDATPPQRGRGDCPEHDGDGGSGSGTGAGTGSGSGAPGSAAPSDGTEL